MERAHRTDTDGHRSPPPPSPPKYRSLPFVGISLQTALPCTTRARTSQYICSQKILITRSTQNYLNSCATSYTAFAKVELTRRPPKTRTTHSMSKILKLTGFTTLSTLLGVSYYYYVVDRPIYQNTGLYKTSKQVERVIDNKAEFVYERMGLDPQLVVQRPFAEIVKDIWNKEVRNTASWLYSWGR